MINVGKKPHKPNKFWILMRANAAGGCLVVSMLSFAWGGRISATVILIGSIANLIMLRHDIENAYQYGWQKGSESK